MERVFTKAELRYLSSGLVFAALLGLGVLVVAAGPWTPVSMERADRALAEGDGAEAMAGYLDLAEHGWTSARRTDALWKAAQLARAEGQLSEALALLKRFAAEHPTHPRTADALADQAEIYLAVMGQPEDAAKTWAAAARHSDDPVRAGGWWLRAGRAWMEVADESRARVAFQAATGTAETSSEGWLALGNLDLQEDPAQAYDAYDHALSAAEGGELGALARLGMATAMERLDGAEAALAEVDADAMGDPALERRRARLEGQLVP